MLSYYAPIPPSLDFAGAAALPAAVETAARALDQLGVAERQHAAGQRRLRQRRQRRGPARRGARRTGDRHRQPGQPRLPALAGRRAGRLRRRAWPSGSARWPPAASTWPSTSPGAASCPSSSSSRAAPSTSDHRRLRRRAGARGPVQPRRHRPRAPRARRDRRADRVRALLAARRADLPARRDRRRRTGSARTATCAGKLVLLVG